MTGKRGRPRIPDTTRAMIVELAGLGKNHSEIARETRISRRSVIRILRDRAEIDTRTNPPPEGSEHG